MKISKFLLIFAIIAGWIFSSWPPVSSFAQEATSTPAESAASSTSSFPGAAISTFNESQDKNVLEEVSNLAPEPPQPTLQPQLPLKERKLNKEVKIDKNASHQCAAKNFTVDISNKNLATVELDLNGRRDSLENLEIGSLPLGIDIAFFNNADYLYVLSQSDSGVVLQITNQPGSQKGNFSVPIIYQSGNSTTICQINVINF